MHSKNSEENGFDLTIPVQYTALNLEEKVRYSAEKQNCCTHSPILIRVRADLHWSSCTGLISILHLSDMESRATGHAHYAFPGSDLSYKPIASIICPKFPQQDFLYLILHKYSIT